MKKILLSAGAIVVLVVLSIGGFVGYKTSTADLSFPDTPYPKIKASTDPAVIEQGRYVVHNVAHCSTCHTQTDGPIDLGTWKLDRAAPISGGYVMQAGPFGTYYAKNLTPDPETGIGRYTDEQLARMIRHGVGHDGAFLPLMRLAVGHMSDEDLTAVISYLRAQQPVKSSQPNDEFGILAKLLADSFSPRSDAAPQHVAAGAEPSVARGEYLANGPALCGGCHTPVDPMEGFAPSGPAYSGGAEPEPDMTDPDYGIIAPNLTPHPEHGIVGQWDEEQFVKRMQGGRVITGSKMPWEAFEQMTQTDIRSIYRYLKSVKPADRAVGPTRVQM